MVVQESPVARREKGPPMTQTLVDRRTLGKRLHMLRFDAGWTLREVETKTGIPQATLARWEKAKGNEYPPVDRLELLAGLYGVSREDLLRPVAPDSPMRVYVKGLVPALAT